MADSAATRQRRTRRHRRGDHSLCPTGRDCVLAAIEAAAPPEPPRTPDVPRDAWRRSREAVELWEELHSKLGVVHRVLLLEACRSVERLDRLDRLIDGRHRRGDWLKLTEGDRGEIRVVVDDLMTEARQQQTTLKSLIAEIRTGLPKETAKPASTTKGPGIASLADAAARRRAASR